MTRELLRLLQQAGALFHKRQLAEAETLCRQILLAEPESVDATNLLALMAKQNAEPEKAEQLMLRCLSLDAARFDIQANLGNLYAQLGRHDAAIAAYEAALVVNGQFRAARLGLARVLHRAGRHADSAAQAQALLQLNAGDAEALNVLATAEQAEGRTREAEQAYRRALQLNPGYSLARHNLGALLAAQSRSEEALRQLERAAAEGVQGPEIAHNLASTLMELGDFDAAERLLVETLAATDTATNLHALLARIRHMRGNSRYLDSLHAAVGKHPENLELQLCLSRLLRAGGQCEHALACLTPGLQASNPDYRILAEVSAALHDSGRYTQALDQARKAVACAPGRPELDELVIRACLALGNASEALPLIEQARQRQPLNQLYLAYEATAARLLGLPRYSELCAYDRLIREYRLPVPSGWSSLEDYNNDLVAVLNERHRFSAPPLDQSLRGGTQTPRGLLNDSHPVVKAFLVALQQPIMAYLDSVGNASNHPLTARNRRGFALAGCWSVRLNRYGYHVNHVHPEGWISSAYYVSVPPEVGDRVARNGWIRFGEPGFPVPGAEAERYFQPEAGKLLLFPSYLWHGTTPIHGDAQRLTVAFDAVPGPDNK